MKKISDKLAKMLVKEGYEVYLWTILRFDEKWERGEIDSYIESLREHKLIIDSLNDAQAHCICNKWHIACTGERTKKFLVKEYKKHHQNWKVYLMILMMTG